MSVVCMRLIRLAGQEARARSLFAAARHTITPTPVTTAQPLTILP